MNGKGIVIMGLGPGDPDLLTRQAWALLDNLKEIYVRTRKHPAVQAFPVHIQIHSFDHYYADGVPSKEVCANIVEEVLTLGRRLQGVVYAVPGHPFYAEATTPEIVRQAHLEDLPVKIIEGLSSLEPLLSALKLGPMPRVSLVDAFELVTRHVPSFPPDAPALITQVFSQSMAAEVKRVLLGVYPGEHALQFIHAAGSPQVQVDLLPLSTIDQYHHMDVQTALYVPPLGPATSFEGFQEIIAHLRAPEGCPWDREQTHQSLRANLLEETYEVLAAIDAQDFASLGEELGDLLLQIVLQAQIASEYGEFRMAEVIHGIHTKLVRRHPHVFGDTQVNGVAEVLQNWERLKAAEREKKGKKEASLLDSTPKALPALTQADQYQARAARVGFEWPDLSDVLDKIQEEIEEVRQAETQEARHDEVGDLFFALVNLARRFDIDAESALREANARFRRRFTYIEDSVRLQSRSLAELSLDEMLRLWEKAKQNTI